MTHFAKIVDGLVEHVIVADQSHVETLDGTWIQTSYNTRGNIHYAQNGEPDGGAALRKNFANIGGIYDVERDAFYEQQPYPSFVFNAETCLWNPPVAHPDDDGKIYRWNEETTSWVEIED